MVGSTELAFWEDVLARAVGNGWGFSGKLMVCSNTT